MNKKIVILAGGFGTRLKHIVPDLPKSLAPINGKAFLDYLITYLSAQGFSDFVLSIHYLKDKIISHFSNFPDKTLNFEFVEEESPLGTGGAIINSIKSANIKGNVIVFNGDSFFNINLKKLVKDHEAGGSNITIALCQMPDTYRYGRAEVNGKHIVSFQEKGISGEGLINSGIYIFNSEWLLTQDLPEKFSIETDFFLKKLDEIKPAYSIHDGYFIDIGVEDDYNRAQIELPKKFYQG